MCPERGLDTDDAKYKGEIKDDVAKLRREKLVKAKARIESAKKKNSKKSQTSAKTKSQQANETEDDE